jgi:hypothetical protein
LAKPQLFRAIGVVPDQVENEGQVTSELRVSSPNETSQRPRRCGKT